MIGRWAIRMPTWLGDSVMAVPTIRVLQRAAPDGLVLWGPEANARLLIDCGIRAQVLPYRRRPGLRGVADVAAGVRELARVGPRGVLLLPNAFEPALIAALARIPRRIGYATEARGGLLTDPIPPPVAIRPTHEMDRYARLLAALQLPEPAPEDIRLQVPDGAREEMRARLGTEPLLAVVPGSANAPAKRWPPAAFARLIERAAEELGGRAVLLGGPGDREVAARICEASSVPCVDLTGRTDLRQLAGALALARAVISNDTGAAHLAAALSRPTLVLYGPTDPRRTRPRGPRVRIASIGAFCQPCESHLCPLDHRCMTAMRPEMVLTSLAPIWRNAERRHDA